MFSDIAVCAAFLAAVLPLGATVPHGIEYRHLRLYTAVLVVLNIAVWPFATIFAALDVAIFFFWMFGYSLDNQISGLLLG